MRLPDGAEARRVEVAHCRRCRTVSSTVLVTHKTGNNLLCCECFQPFRKGDVEVTPRRTLSPFARR